MNHRGFVTIRARLERARERRRESSGGDREQETGSSGGSIERRRESSEGSIVDP